MTNEELDVARAKRAAEIWGGTNGTLAIIAARLAREGWTPPAAVDPDIAEAVKLANEYAECDDWPFLANWFLKAIRRGRELERAVMGNPIPEQIQEVTPPEPVNPDLLLARKIEAGRLGVPPTVSNAILHGAHDGDIEIERTLETIKRGRELERAEAEPGMVWVKHDGSGECPISVHQPVLITNINGFYGEGLAGAFYWNRVTHYAVITPPEDVA